jgi:hypothetical protein
MAVAKGKAGSSTGHPRAEPAPADAPHALDFALRRLARVLVDIAVSASAGDRTARPGEVGQVDQRSSSPRRA